MSDLRTYCCCACCDGIAADDHVENGGSVERDGHAVPCVTCEEAGYLRDRLAEAWDEGWNAAVDSNGYPGDVNPYRMTTTNPTPGDLRQVRAAGERSEK